MLRHVFLLSIFSRLFFFFLAKVNEKFRKSEYLKFDINVYQLTILIVNNNYNLRRPKLFFLFQFKISYFNLLLKNYLNIIK